MNNSNKVISLRTLDMIDDEAAIWLVRLDNGKLSKQAKVDLRSWLSADKRHEVALKAMADTWDDMDDVLLNLSAEQDIDKVSILPILAPIFKPLAVAASVSFIAIFMWLFMPAEVHTNTYMTAIGQRLDTQFDDGSVIHLNTNSLIETEFSKEKRIIKLVKGEALFEVAHDPERPFIVYAGDRLVQAIGTKFVVHLKHEDIQVTVTDGKVKMSAVSPDTQIDEIKALNSSKINKDDVFIAKGEKAVVGFNQAPTLTHFETDNVNRELSWLNGKLIFKNEKLSDIIKEVNRYVDMKIVLNDNSIDSLRISGRFDLGNSEALIEAIELSFNVQSQRVDSNTILLSKKI